MIYESEEGNPQYEYSTVASQANWTVLAEYRGPEYSAGGHQTEAQLEEALIRQLERQGYEYAAHIRDEESLKANLRLQLERLNRKEILKKTGRDTLSEDLWQRFYSHIMGESRELKGIEACTRLVQEKGYSELSLPLDTEGKKTLFLQLFEKREGHLASNHLQVINQYVAQGEGEHAPTRRYDVTLLVNGFPLVQIELKRRGVSLKEAFNQIKRYAHESYDGLFGFLQLFVISNGTDTRYYSNTTRSRHTKGGGAGAANSFEFTCRWADRRNRDIMLLEDFASEFFDKQKLLHILFRYCVFTASHELMVMRPYQIAAAEEILERVKLARGMRKWGQAEARGYIWHTTGSGKTLTSFKTAQLVSQLPEIEKVLFVVDRKDLDYQTMCEYEHYQKGAANSNTNTAMLRGQLEDPSCRIIITTIQKLSRLVRKYPQLSVYGQQVVMIFDECHRSQFGDMQLAISKRFKKLYLFGFTGTPIMEENAVGMLAGRSTTRDIFSKCLHKYTIVNAIQAGNVLPFKVDYYGTMKRKEEAEEEQVADINRESALLAPERVEAIVRHILEIYAEKTQRQEQYEHSRVKDIARVVRGRRGDAEREKVVVSGFNSLFAAQSIEAAKCYYAEFQRQMQALEESKRLRIALIYSQGVETDGPGGMEEENSESAEGLSMSDRDFLARAIEDYNRMFTQTYDTSASQFSNYYCDVSMRLKNRELDMLIVVNMFLTGFDAKTLNTLWVDKNLRMHGLLQAFSRTNRILNSIKKYGNIVCFRNLEYATNESILLYGDGNPEVGRTALVRKFNDYYYGYRTSNPHEVVLAHGEEKPPTLAESTQEYEVPGYVDLVDRLKSSFPIGTPIENYPEEKQRAFVETFNEVIRGRNFLKGFEEFHQMEKEHLARAEQGEEPLPGSLTPLELQDYQGLYLAAHDILRVYKEDGVDIADDLVFEIELIKSVDIDISYILRLIEEMAEEQKASRAEWQAKLRRMVGASPQLRDKLDLIEAFILEYSGEDGYAAQDSDRQEVGHAWLAFLEKQQRRELDDIICSEKLDASRTYRYMQNAFARRELRAEGTQFSKLLPKGGGILGAEGKKRQALKERVYKQLNDWFQRFLELGDGTFGGE